MSIEEFFPIIDGKQFVVSTNLCMICNSVVKDPNFMALNIKFPTVYLIYCNAEQCKRTAQYNKLRILYKNKCISMDTLQLFGSDIKKKVSILRSDNTVTDNCLIQEGRLLQFSSSRNCVSVWASLPKMQEKLSTLQDLIKHNSWILNKFKKTNGIHIKFEDNEFWPVPDFANFHESVEKSIKELNKEFF